MFYIALCDDEWQAVEILTGYLSEIGITAGKCAFFERTGTGTPV